MPGLFEWGTSPVVIWFSEEYRWLAMLPPVVIQFAPGSACSWKRSTWAKSRFAALLTLLMQRRGTPAL